MKLKSYLHGIRFGEIAVMQGPPLMGVIMSVVEMKTGMVMSLALFILASFLIVAHIWTLNDWSDYEVDQNKRSRCRVVDAPRVTRRDLLLLSLGALAGGVVILGFLPWKTFVIGGAMVALGVVYSFPGIRTKGRGALSSVSHFMGGILHFLFGYSLFGALDQTAFLISIFFALVFTAGHATQEVQDYEDDVSSGVRTNAVVFGKHAIFAAAFGGFAIAFLYLAALAVAGLVPTRLAFSALLFPLQALCTVRVVRCGLTRENLAWLRCCYRGLFGVIGLLILSCALVQ